jgi:integrase
MKSRSVQIFEEYIQSEITRKHYRYYLQRFVTHYNLESFDSILSLKTEDLKKKLEDYVILFKNNGKSPNYIRLIIFAIQSFCDSNDKMGINWKKIRRLLGKKQKPKKSRPYTTSEIKRMLHSLKSIRNKSLILFLSSSGVRRGAIPTLKMKDLKQMSHGCVAITVYAGFDEEYVTFINKEANDALMLYFEQRKHSGEPITPNSFVFRANRTDITGNPKPLNEASISNLILRCKINAGVNFDKSPNLLCHAFRRRFNTILKLNQDSTAPLIERLMGHDMQLDNSYFQPTLENLFEEYQKGMSDLAIDDSERLMAEREIIQTERTQLESEIQHNKNLESRMNTYEQNQEEVIHVMNMIKNGDAILVDMANKQIKVKLKQK